MSRKIFSLFICFVFLGSFSTLSASAFSWFGFGNDNSQVIINTGGHPDPACYHGCGHKKPPKPPKGPKHKPKHEHHKKPQKPHKCYFWWCK